MISTYNHILKTSQNHRKWTEKKEGKYWLNFHTSCSCHADFFHHLIYLYIKFHMYGVCVCVCVWERHLLLGNMTSIRVQFMLSILGIYTIKVNWSNIHTDRYVSALSMSLNLNHFIFLLFCRNVYYYWIIWNVSSNKSSIYNKYVRFPFFLDLYTSDMLFHTKKKLTQYSSQNPTII